MQFNEKVVIVTGGASGGPHRTGGLVLVESTTGNMFAVIDAEQARGVAHLLGGRSLAVRCDPALSLGTGKATLTPR